MSAELAPKLDVIAADAPVVSVTFREYVTPPGMSDTTRLMRVTQDKSVDRHIAVDRIEADAIGIRAFKGALVERYPWHVIRQAKNVPEYDLGDAFEKLSEALLKRGAK